MLRFDWRVIIFTATKFPYLHATWSGVPRFGEERFTSAPFSINRVTILDVTSGSECSPQAKCNSVCPLSEILFIPSKSLFYIIFSNFS